MPSAAAHRASLLLPECLRCLYQDLTVGRVDHAEHLGIGHWSSLGDPCPPVGLPLSRAGRAVRARVAVLGHALDPRDLLVGHSRSSAFPLTSVWTPSVSADSTILVNAQDGIYMEAVLYSNLSVE